LRCEPPVAILPSLLREGVRQSKSLAMNLQNFFGELRQRHVYRVAITYAIVAWLLIQIATQVFPFFEIPNWVVRLVVLVIVLGFPLALILAWAFEITPQGIKRAENIAPTFIGDLTSEKRKEAWAAAASDAEKAVAIDSNLAEAHAALGWVRFFTEWNFAEGLAQLRRANQLSPWNSTANDLLARVVVYLGQFEEAEELARQAIELDPLAYQPRTSLARVLSAEGKLDEAEAAGRKGVELQLSAAGCRRWQVFVAIQRSNSGAAALREAQLEPNEGYRRFELALAHYARGDRAAADASLAELIANDRNFLAYQIAEVYAWRGENDKAFEWLQISLDKHDTGTLSLLIDPLMRGLRHDARYNGLLAKIGLPLSRS